MASRSLPRRVAGRIKRRLRQSARATGAPAAAGTAGRNGAGRKGTGGTGTTGVKGTTGRSGTRGTTGRPAPASAGRPPRHLLPPGAEVYGGLVGQSLHLSGIRHGAVEPAVSVVLPPLEPSKIFAGVATALEFGSRLALALDRPLRIVPFNDGPAKPLEESVTAFLAKAGGSRPPVRVVVQPMLAHTTVSADDVWVVTYWTTAHAADVARRLNVLDPERVVYLIQDYEPGFHDWSLPHALTRATYHAGFHHVVNSRSLAEYLAAREGKDADQGLVIAPHLDLDRLAQVAEKRRRNPNVRVFFYGRPGKPRNLYPLGVAALRAAAGRLAADGVRWEGVSAGEPHQDITLPARGVTGGTSGAGIVRSLGTLDWAGYYNLLTGTDVGLTLMLSPHPSHPPLEVAVSGGLAVTNDLDGSRGGFHPRITATAADPDALADALVSAVKRAAQEGPGEFTPPAEGLLGDLLDEVIERLVPRLP
jgi:hypothetical protein